MDNSSIPMVILHYLERSDLGEWEACGEAGGGGWEERGGGGGAGSGEASEGMSRDPGACWALYTPGGVSYQVRYDYAPDLPQW